MICFNATKVKHSSSEEPYNHCPYFPQSRWMFLWISLLMFRSQVASESSWWLSTDFLNMLIFSHYPTHLPPLWSLKLSWTRYSNYMACPPLFSVIVSRPSPVTFGKNFSSCKAPKSNKLLHIIPKLMVKMKQSPNFWGHT